MAFGKSRNPDGTVKDGYIGKFSMTDSRGGWQMTDDEKKSSRRKIMYHENTAKNLESRKLSLGFVFENGRIQDVGPTPPGFSPREPGQFVTIQELIVLLRFRQTQHGSMNIAVNRDWNFFICIAGHIHEITRHPSGKCRECGQYWRWQVKEGVLLSEKTKKIAKTRVLGFEN